MGVITPIQPAPIPCHLEGFAVARPDIGARADRGDNTLLVIAIENRGSSDWHEVELTIRGFNTGAANSGQPEPHTLRMPLIKAGVMVAQDIDKFKKQDGTPWVSATTRPEKIVVGANVNGRGCTFEQRFSGSRNE